MWQIYSSVFTWFYIRLAQIFHSVNITVRHYTTRTAADSAQFFWEESVLPDTADRFQLKIYSKTANMHTGPQSLITTALHHIQEQCTLALNHTQNKKLSLLPVCRQTLLHYHLSFKSNRNNNPFCKVEHPGTHTHTTHLYTLYISNLKVCIVIEIQDNWLFFM